MPVLGRDGKWMAKVRAWLLSVDRRSRDTIDTVPDSSLTLPKPVGN